MNKYTVIIIVFFKKSSHRGNTGLTDTTTESRARKKSNMLYLGPNLQPAQCMTCEPRCNSNSTAREETTSGIPPVHPQILKLRVKMFRYFDKYNEKTSTGQ